MMTPIAGLIVMMNDSNWFASPPEQTGVVQRFNPQPPSRETATRACRPLLTIIQFQSSATLQGDCNPVASARPARRYVLVSILSHPPGRLQPAVKIGFVVDTSFQSSATL